MLQILALLQKALSAVTALPLLVDGWEFNRILLGITKLFQAECGHLLANFL
jgi:hypothetical protein